MKRKTANFANIGLNTCLHEMKPRISCFWGHKGLCQRIRPLDIYYLNNRGSYD